MNLISQRIYRSYDESIRKDISWDERWKGEDKGLISCWETGREMRERDPDIKRRCENGELPPTGWKGGVEKKIKKEKFGTLNYLAERQGILGLDLDINLYGETELICSRTGVKVIYTGDSDKYCNE